MKIAFFILFLVVLAAFEFVNHRLMRKSREAAGSSFSFAYVFNYVSFPEFFVLLLLGAIGFGLACFLVGIPGAAGQ
jgi:hypothetical protein